ncbi:8344_t:CDS:1, partial [Gigaspora rosea]
HGLKIFNFINATKYSTFEIKYDTFSRKLFVWKHEISNIKNYNELYKTIVASKFNNDDWILVVNNSTRTNDAKNKLETFAANTNKNIQKIIECVSEYELIDCLKERFFTYHIDNITGINNNDNATKDLYIHYMKSKTYYISKPAILNNATSFISNWNH